ncbi:tellurite resistance/C4-dicarboxylate transporter family protein [Flexivirga sp. B27]
MTAGVLGRTRDAVERLSPGYFALVMATGIVSSGLRLDGATVLADVLLVVAGVAFVGLVVLNVWRLVAFRSRAVTDFFDPQLAFGYFTSVAAAGVLASGVSAHGMITLALVLFIAGFAAWLLLGYAIPWATMLDRSHHPTVRGANGSWFLWVVSSQSVATMAAILERHLHAAQHLFAMIAVVAWSVGVFLYGAESMLIALREMMYDADFAPSYWVCMGAASITVLAGAEILDSQGSTVVANVAPILDAATLMFWSFASWLLPMLILAFCWRHFIRHVPLGYDSALWSMVFPLGMYAVASVHLGEVEELPWVEHIGRVELWLAFAIWCVVFVGFLRRIFGTVLTSRARGVADQQVT